MTLRSLLFGVVAILAMTFLTLGNSANAEPAGISTTTVGIDDIGLGYINVYELGGGFIYGQGLDLDNGASSGSNGLTLAGAGTDTLTFSPTYINDPNIFWYQDTGSGPANIDGTGNKDIEANGFAEDQAGTYQGQTLTFEFNIAEFTLDLDYSFFAFIGDFEPGFANPDFTTTEITGTGIGSVSATISNNGPVQWGFRMFGANQSFNDQQAGTFGSVVINNVPEPGTMATFGLVMFGLAGRRRRS